MASFSRLVQRCSSECCSNEQHICSALVLTPCWETGKDVAPTFGAHLAGKLARMWHQHYWCNTLLGNWQGWGTSKGLVAVSPMVGGSSQIGLSDGLIIRPIHLVSSQINRDRLHLQVSSLHHLLANGMDESGVKSLHSFTDYVGKSKKDSTQPLTFCIHKQNLERKPTHSTSGNPGYYPGYIENG